MTAPIKVVIIGSGGGSRDVLDILEAHNAQRSVYNILGFIVETEYALPGTVVNGKPILGSFDWLAEHCTEVQVICGVGQPALRLQLVEKAKSCGVTFCSVIHPTVIMTPHIEIGIDTTIGAGCILTNQIRIHDHVQVNIGCTLSHDVTLHDYTTLSPGVHLAGNITVGQGAFIGIGATVIEQKRVGDWSVVGAGSTIIHDVPRNTTVVGVPGRVIKYRAEGWQR